MRLQRGFLAFITAMALFGSAEAGQRAEAAGGLSGDELIRKIEPSVALILAGGGGGRLTGVGSGFVIGSNGMLLTAYHLIRGAHEVQVRMMNGEVYDRVELVGFDERRDVAALHILAAGLGELAPLPVTQITEGQSAFAVSSPDGRHLSLSDAVITGTRLADEVPNAGTGYRVIQFLTSAPTGSNGSILVDAKGRALGLVAGSSPAGASSFAIPLESVLGLASAASRTELGSGKDLQLPRSAQRERLNPQDAGAPPANLLGTARKIFISSRTVWFKPELLQRELFQQPDFIKWGITVVKHPKAADLLIVVDRPALTYDFTFTVTDPRGEMVFASGKVTSIDGRTAAPQLAKAIADQVRVARAAH